MFNIITKPTRVTPISATLIDHVITNDIAHTIVPSIILSHLMDHYPVSCSIKQFKSLKSSISNVHFYRDRKNFCPEMFCVELNNSLLQLISTNFPLHSENFNKTFDNFVKTISQIINKHALLKQLTRKQQKLAKKPWITKGISTLIRKKNIIFKSMLINGNETEKKYF